MPRANAVRKGSRALLLIARLTVLGLIALSAQSQPAQGSSLRLPQSVAVSGLSLGAVASYALLPGGGLKAWGSNLTGQIGDGTTMERHVPVDVHLQPSDQVRQGSGGGGHVGGATLAGGWLLG